MLYSEHPKKSIKEKRAFIRRTFDAQRAANVRDHADDGSKVSSFSFTVVAEIESDENSLRK